MAHPLASALARAEERTETMATRLSAEQKKRAIELYEAGYTLAEAGAATGIAPGTMSRVLSACGVFTRKREKQYLHLQPEAVRLHIDEQLTVKEVATRLGVGGTTVARLLTHAGAKRSMGEAFALAAQKGRKRHRAGIGRQCIPWQSSKTGQWEFADSRWEVLRMQQLDADETVLSWTRVGVRIEYVDANGVRRFYSPDFFVTYISGERVAEEIKPSCFLENENVQRKAAAARRQLDGWLFRFVTENELGRDALRAFKLEGVAEYLEEPARKARRQRQRRRWDAKNADRVAADKRMFLERAHAAADLYRSGKTLDEVAAAFGKSVHAVLWWLDKVGCKRRPAVMRPHQRIAQGNRRRAAALANRGNTSS